MSMMETSVTMSVTKPSRRRHRCGRGKAIAQEQEKERWLGPEERTTLMGLVPRCVVEHDRGEVMALLREPAVLLREAGRHAEGDEAQTEVMKKTMKEQLTLLQGACLEGGSVHLVSMLLLNGASPNVVTPTKSMPTTKGRKGRTTGGFPPLLLALIGSGRERNKILKELLVYGADVHLKDAQGFSFHDLTTGHEAYRSLHQFIAQAAKDPRTKKVKESLQINDVKLQSMQRSVMVSRGLIKLEEMADPLESLPPELSLHIFSFLSLPELATVCLVSSLWRCVATDHDLWRGLYVRQFGAIPPSEEPNFQRMLQRAVELKAKQEADSRAAEMIAARFFIQAIHHPHCDHRGHQEQVAFEKPWWDWGGFSISTLDRSTRRTTHTTAGFWDVNRYLDIKTVRIKNQKILCTSVSGNRKSYKLRVGDKLMVHRYNEQNGVCKVYYFSLTLSREDDHLKPPTIVHIYNRA